jgi:hypothetical protein
VPSTRLMGRSGSRRTGIGDGRARERRLVLREEFVNCRPPRRDRHRRCRDAWRGEDGEDGLTATGTANHAPRSRRRVVIVVRRGLPVHRAGCAAGASHRAMLGLGRFVTLRRNNGRPVRSTAVPRQERRQRPSLENEPGDSPEPHVPAERRHRRQRSGPEATPQWTEARRRWSPASLIRCEGRSPARPGPRARPARWPTPARRPPAPVQRRQTSSGRTGARRRASLR